MREIAKKIKSSKLFMGMSEDDIVECLKDSKALVEEFSKDELIFHIGDEPRYIKIELPACLNKSANR